MLAVSNAAGKLVTMLVWLFLARFVSANDFALASYFRTTLNTISSSVNFGYTNYIIRSAVNRGNQRKKILVVVFKFLALIAATGFALVVFVVQKLLGLHFNALTILCVNVSAVTALWIQILLAADQARSSYFSTILFNLLVAAVAVLSSATLVLFNYTAYTIAYAAVSVLLLVGITIVTDIRCWKSFNHEFRSTARAAHRTLVYHLLGALKLTGMPYVSNLPIIGLKWAVETNLITDFSERMGPYYIAMMVFSLCMTLLYSASQPIFVKVSKDKRHYWSIENLYANFLLMSAISFIAAVVPPLAYELALPDYDPKLIKHFISNTLVLGLLFSYKQGYGRVVIASGQTSIMVQDNLITFIALFGLSLVHIQVPMDFIEAQIISAVFGNLVYLAWALRARGLVSLLDFSAIHTATLLYWGLFNI